MTLAVPFGGATGSSFTIVWFSPSTVRTSSALLVTLHGKPRLVHEVCFVPGCGSAISGRVSNVIASFVIWDYSWMQLLGAAPCMASSGSVHELFCVGAASCSGLRMKMAASAKLLSALMPLADY